MHSVNPIDQLVDQLNKRDPYGRFAEVEVFEMSKFHVRLLHHMYVDWNDQAYDGAPAIGLKRPYGNSDMLSDIAEIVVGQRGEFPNERHGKPYLDPEEYTRFDREGEIISIDVHDEDGIQVLPRQALEILHRETQVALQIVLSTGSWEPGTYRKTRQYDRTSWERVS